MENNLQEIREHITDGLVPAPHQKGFYICPLCGSGLGNNGKKTAAFSIDRDGIHGKCFSCGFYGDIFDLEAAKNGKPLPEATRDVVARYEFKPSNIEQYFMRKAREAMASPSSTGSPSPAAAPVSEPNSSTPPPAADHSDFYQTAHKALMESPEALEYLRKRMISDESIARFNLGYCAAWKHSKAPASVPGTKRLIIPRSGRTFTARRIDKPANDYEEQFKKQIEGSQSDLFNIQALNDSEIVWVVEGELDAISLYQTGASAVVGIGSISNKRRFAEEAKKHPEKVFILALDNDKDQRGQKAQAELASDLESAGLVCCSVDSAELYGGSKDANDAYVTDRERLGLHVAIAEAKAYEDQQAKAEARAQELYARTGAGMLDSFLEVVQTREFEPIPTGVTDIDRATHGGFTSKTLVLLSGAPGLGKTALAQWITENIARSGRDVLFINLEMSREQLLARSLARTVWLNEKADLSPLDVLRGYAWSEEQRAALARAAESYKKEIAPRFIYNPDGLSNGLEDILRAMDAETIRVKAQGRPAPIVCVDYLQLIDAGERDPVEGLKKAIYLLKDFAKKNNTVVIAISATNRAANKSGTVDLESGRDTSATEYSGDMMLGLSYTAIEDHRKYDTGKVFSQGPQKGERIMAEYTLDELRRLRRVAYDFGNTPPKECNEISLKVLKNRFGEPERRAKLFFDGRHNLYTQIFEEPQEYKGKNWEVITQ
jgi:replicative DNA helicase